MRPPHPFVFVGLALAAVLAAGCGPSDSRPAAWADPGAGLVVGTDACVGSIRVDLFVDATTSMQGFVEGRTEYLDFLNGLEAAVSSGWTDDSLRYHKFGSVVRAIERDEFRGVRDAAFYRERGIFERTNIDAVVERVEPGRVAVVVTDLFQDDGDVNAVVASIESRVIQPGLAVGVLAVPSAFAGTVYDAPGGAYRYASTADDPDSRRPFYALLFGEAPCLRRMDEVIRSQPYASDAQFLLIGPSIMEGFRVELAKPRDERGLSPRTPPGPNHFAFNMRDEAETARLEGTAVLDPLAAAPDVEAGRIALEAFRKALPAAGDSVATGELRLADARRTGDTLRFSLAYAPEVEPGPYTYLVRLQTGDIRGLGVPAWIEDLSTTDPTAEVDANRTLNLATFVGDLLQASSSSRPPSVAQFILDINRL